MGAVQQSDLDTKALYNISEYLDNDEPPETAQIPVYLPRG
jgi:hypothetical protein